MPPKSRQTRRRPTPGKPAEVPVEVSAAPSAPTPDPVLERPEAAKPAARTVDGRPACYLVDECGLPEFMDNVGLCGRHWALRPDVRKVARRG